MRRKMSKDKEDPKDFIYDLLQAHGVTKIRASQDQLRCGCPFHGGRNLTSFMVDFKKDIPFFHCYSCQENGDLPKLVAFLTGKSYRKSSKLIQIHTNIGVCNLRSIQESFKKLHQTFQKPEDIKVELPPRAVNQKPLLNYMEKRWKKYHKVLLIEYIINKYRLYYCAEGRMAGRIIMPIYLDGQLMGYNDRTVNDKLKEKSLHLLGSKFDGLIHGLQEALGKPKGAVVEGSFDMYQVASVLATDEDLAAEYGCVNLMGSSFSDAKITTLVDNFQELIIMLDHDKSGLEGGFKAYPKLREYVPVRHVSTVMPKDKDPGKCTAKQIKKILRAKGWCPSGYLDTVQQNTQLNI